VGGSFFDSDSSSSDSFTSDSDSERVKEHHHTYDSPPHHDGDEVASGGNGPLVFFMVFAFGIFLVGFYNKDANGNTVTVLKLQVFNINIIVLFFLQLLLLVVTS